MDERDVIVNADSPAKTFRYVMASRGELGPGDLDRLVHEHEMTLRSTVPVIMERQLVSGRRIETCSYPIPTDGYVSIFRDFTEQKAMSKMKDKFISTVSHELRTPLALLSGSLFRLRKLIPSAASALAHLKTAEAESKRIGHLVDQLMLLSDLDTNQFPWKLEVADLVALVDDWKRQRPQPDQHPIHLLSGATPILVRVDRDALRRVLDQLLQNSLEFSDGQAQVWIEMQRQQQEACLVFADSGPGMGTEPCDQTIDIFQRFQRLEQHRSAQRGDGCGLGLAIVRELMQGMGGGAEIAPATAPNERSGLRLRLKLPLAHSPQA